MSNPEFKAIPARVCVKCGGTNFYEFPVKCRACAAAQRPDKATVAAYNAAYRLKNADSIKVKQKIYRQENKERIDAVKAKYIEKNQEKIRAKKFEYRQKNQVVIDQQIKIWHQENKPSVIAANKKYNAKNTEKIRKRATLHRQENRGMYRVYTQNRKSSKLLSGGNLSKDLADKLFKLQNGKCPCCKEPLGNDFHLDHIQPLALGGSNTDDNIQLLRKTCNLQKSMKHPVDFMQSRGFLL